MYSFSPMERGSPDAFISGVRMNLKSSFDSLDEKGGNMKVFCRLRPMLPREQEAGYSECVAVIDDQVVRTFFPSSSQKFKNGSHSGQEIMEDFKYSLAFGPEVGQFKFFHQTIMDVMQGFIEGQNSLIFSYGITNSGKTYTLQGDEANPGLIPLAMHLFFSCIEHQMCDEIYVKPEKYSDYVKLTQQGILKAQQLKDNLLQTYDQEATNKSNSTANSTKSFAMSLCEGFYNDFEHVPRESLQYEDSMAAQSAMVIKDLCKKSADEQSGLVSVWVSFIEIYNEYIYDLLQSNINARAKLNLAEDQNGDVYVKGAREVCVSSSEEAIKLLNIGRKNLRIASTKLNYQSSRSHCIFTVKVIRILDENASNARVNRISFCDLAGSERAAKSQTTGVRLREAGYINTSLLVLGRCLDQLRLNQTAREKKMIPYRESKLTRLFHGHFIGKGKAAMIANASPCELTFDETLNVLRFSALAKELMMNDSYISTTCNSLQGITDQWAISKAHAQDVSLDESNSVLDSSLWDDLKERDEMIEKLLDLADNLRNNLEKERQEKARLEEKVREDVCREYSEYSDQLVENQRRIGEERVDFVKSNYQKRLLNMERAYEDRIKQLISRLEECEESFEESMNETFVKDTSKSENIPASSSVGIHIETDDMDLEDDQMSDEILTTEISSKQSAIEAYIKEIASLREELAQVKKELEITKGQLQHHSDTLNNSLTDKSSHQKDNDALNSKLEQANKILEEYKKDLDEIKLTSVSFEEKNTILKEEKRQLHEELSALKERMAKAAEEKCNELNIELLNSVNALESEKIKLSMTAEALEEQKTKFNKIQVEYDAVKNANIKLLEDYSDLEENFNNVKLELVKASQECIELNVKLLNSTNCQELEKLKLNIAIEALEEQKLMYNEMELKYNAVKSANVELLEDYSIMEENLNNVKLELERIAANSSELEKALEASADNTMVVSELQSKCKELSSALEVATAAIEDKNAKIMDFATHCDTYEKQNSELLEQYSSLEENYNNVKRELDAAMLQIETLTNEKNVTEELHNTYVAETKEGSKTADELKSKLEESTQQLERKNQEINELNLQLENVTKALEDQVSKFQTLEEESLNSKNVNAKLVEDCKSLSEQLDNALKENLSNKDEHKNLTDRINELQTQYSKCGADYTELLENHEILEKAFDALTEQLAKLDSEYEKLKSEKLDAEAMHATALTELQESETSLKNIIKELEKTVQELEDTVHTLKQSGEENIELKEKLRHLENKYNALAEQQDEFNNLSRQVKEQEASIEQLERAMFDTQQLKKETETKLEKRIADLQHQHAIEVEELVNLKKTTEEENLKLKSELTEVNGQNNESSELEETRQSQESRTNKTSRKRKPDPPKTRALRSRQVKTSQLDDLRGDSNDSDDDFVPSKSTSRRVLRSGSKLPKPPAVKRSTRNKQLQEDVENMSPVQKMKAFGNNILRNVAETVSKVPSPRVTRGKKKLFNVEASSSAMGPKWKL